MLSCSANRAAQRPTEMLYTFLNPDGDSSTNGKNDRDWALSQPDHPRLNVAPRLRGLLAARSRGMKELAMACRAERASRSGAQLRQMRAKALADIRERAKARRHLEGVDEALRLT